MKTVRAVTAEPNAAKVGFMLAKSQAEILEGLKRAAVQWIASQGLGLPEAEDVFQQAILKAISTTSEADEPEKLTSWFYQILRNTLIDEFRKQKLQKKKIEEFTAEISPSLDTQTTEKLCQCVSGLMSDLAPQEKEILEKHFYDGKKFKELATEFGQTENAIRVKALRARGKLKELLSTCCKSMNDAKNCDCG